MNGERGERRPARVWGLVLAALAVLGAALIAGAWTRNEGPMPGDAPLPPDTAPMQRFIPDSQFPEHPPQKEGTGTRPTPRVIALECRRADQTIVSPISPSRKK